MSGDTSIRRRRGYFTSAPPTRTDLQIALDIGDYWRARAIQLLEENVLLRRRIAEAVAEALRIENLEWTRKTTVEPEAPTEPEWRRRLEDA